MGLSARELRLAPAGHDYAQPTRLYFIENGYGRLLAAVHC